MRKNGLQAVAYMEGLSKKGAAGVKGMCLKTCRLAWGLPGGTPSAIMAWNSVPPAHRHRDPMKAPIGAPHFWTGSRGALKKYGHIALQAEHEGFVWSTDAPDTDKVGLVHLDWFQKKWGATYLGWSSMLNGEKLPLGEEAPK